MPGRKSRHTQAPLPALGHRNHTAWHSVGSSATLAPKRHTCRGGLPRGKSGHGRMRRHGNKGTQDAAPSSCHSAIDTGADAGRRACRTCRGDPRSRGLQAAHSARQVLQRPRDLSSGGRESGYRGARAGGFDIPTEGKVANISILWTARPILLPLRRARRRGATGRPLPPAHGIRPLPCAQRPIRRTCAPGDGHYNQGAPAVFRAIPASARLASLQDVRILVTHRPASVLSRTGMRVRAPCLHSVVHTIGSPGGLQEV
jgi:hypothetical protein